MKFIAIASLIGTISAIQLGVVPLDANKNPIKTGKEEKGNHGNGAVDQGPEPPLTKVYQEVDMSSKCSNGVCHVKECFDGKCKTYDKKQPPKFEFQKPDSNWKGKDQKKESTEAAPAKTEAKQDKEETEKETKKKIPKTEAPAPTKGPHEPSSILDAKPTEEKQDKPKAKAGAGWAHKEQESEKDSEPTQEKEEKAPHLTIPEKAVPSSTGSSHTKAKIADYNMIQNGNLKQINSMIKEVQNRPPTEANKLLLDGIVDDTMIDMDIYSGKKTKEAADILKDKTLAMVKSSEIEQEMVQTNSVLNNIEKLLTKSSKK